MSNKDPNTFTARDFELLAGSMKCLKSELVVDYAKFAQRMGFKNGNSGKAAWHNLKKKLDKMADGGSCEPSLTITPAEVPETPRASGKKRKATDDNADLSDDNVSAQTSKKAKRGRKQPFGMGKGKAAAPQDGGIERDDAEEVPVEGEIKAESGDDS